MNKTLLITILLILISSCKNQTDYNVVEFNANCNCCDEFGFPLDSTAKYFPEDLFNDTIPCILDESSIKRLDNYGTKENFAKLYKKDINNLKDTFEIAEDTLLLKYISYALYKMNEPILYDHYLNKEIYRILSMRAFNPPLVISIENYLGNISITFKKLNKAIRYPFMVYVTENDSILYCQPDVAAYDPIQKKTIVIYTLSYTKLYLKNKKFQDSMAKAYNVINYKLIENRQVAVSKRVWNSLQIKIDSSNFWQTKPNIALDYPLIDGSRWILEGHTKEGYQIKIIPSPNFDNYDYVNYFDEDNSYVKIFKYLIKTLELENEGWY
jgi:hypothetical protein